MNGYLKELANGLTASVDWLSFTIKELNTVDDVLHLLGYERRDFDDMPHGGKGYKSMVKLTGYPVTVMFDGNDDMGIHVDVSGSAIAEIIRSFKSTLEISTPFGTGYDVDFDSTFLRELISSIRKYGHLTRLDLAVDDIGCRFFSTDDLASLYHEKKIVSKFRTLKNVVEYESPDSKTGHTLYFGSRQSDVFLRVYDKRLEQNKKRKSSDAPSITSPWVRWELECKGKKADAVANLILSGMDLGNIIVGSLGNYMRVIDLDNDNRSRCTVNSTWIAFLSGIEPLRLSLATVEKDIEDKKKWIVKQVMPTLATIIMADGGSYDFITANLHSGCVRMKKHLWDMVAKHNPDILNS